MLEFLIAMTCLLSLAAVPPIVRRWSTQLAQRRSTQEQRAAVDQGKSDAGARAVQASGPKNDVKAFGTFVDLVNTEVVPDGFSYSHRDTLLLSATLFVENYPAEHAAGAGSIQAENPKSSTIVSFDEFKKDRKRSA